MINRKSNRLKGYDYSQNNLYFVTNCVKDNLCCLGSVVSVGTGRDLSVHHPESNHPKSIHPESHHSEIEYRMILNRYGFIVDEKINWLMQQYKYVDIHNYVVMPNHIHLILEIDCLKVTNQEIKIKSLSSLMGAFKTTSANQIHQEGFEDFAWHRSFHDHIIRDEKSYLNISNYIDMNPQKWIQDKFYSA
uniref:transposase n=1 Tax=Flavobacterium sp. TaxID=239 RepID=UPI004048EE95